jgi:hypothetical protein
MRLTNRREFMTNLGCFSGLFGLLTYFAAGEVITRPNKPCLSSGDKDYPSRSDEPRFAIGDRVQHDPHVAYLDDVGTVTVRLHNLDDGSFEYLVRWSDTPYLSHHMEHVLEHAH